MVKRLVIPGAVRQPALRLLIAGKSMPGIVTASVSITSHFQAATWSCRIALNATGGQTVDWWGQDARKSELWDIRASLDGSDERSLIVGEADELDLDIAAGTIEARGRDLTARLIEASTQEAFQNRTASEIATLLAGRHELTAVVDATTVPVSRYYGADHDRVTHDQFSHVSREWDLLKHLAEFENYDLFVKGTELHFQKAVDPSKTQPYVVTWDADLRRTEVQRLALHRSLSLAKKVVVKIRVWASSAGKPFTVYSPANGKSIERNGDAQVFAYQRPNLSLDQAQKLSETYRDQITRHQRTVSFECPGELDLTPRDQVKVNGVGDGWGGQQFFVTTIRRDIDFGRGFTMRVEGKNSDPVTDTGGAA